MTHLRRVTAVLAALLAVAGCARSAAQSGTPGNATVIPFESGVFQSTAQARSEQGALRDALAGARAECSARRQALSVVDATTVYSGLGGETTRKAMDVVKEILGDVGVDRVPDGETGRDYTAKVEFRCR